MKCKVCRSGQVPLSSLFRSRATTVFHECLPLRCQVLKIYKIARAMLHTYPNWRNEVKIEVDSTVSLMFGKSIQPLNGLKWFKPFIDCYSHTIRTHHKLLSDVMGLSNSCTDKESTLETYATEILILNKSLTCSSIN